MAIAAANKVVHGNDLTYITSKYKEYFQAKESGKGLSTNDYTTAEKDKLAGVASGAEVNVVKSVDTTASNGANLSLNSAGKLDVSIDTNVIATKTYVNEQIGSITGISYQVVQSLPASGSAGVIYLVPNSGTSPNIYDEYIWTGSAFEKIGTTDVDLSNYVQYDDLVALTTSEIETLLNL